MNKIEFSRHSIKEEDIERAVSVLKSIFITTGDAVHEFENKFEKFLNIRSVIGVTSCTAALHLSLIAWDINEGDEVITTPLSFCATSNAILHARATPVFVDVEEETGNINTKLIESKITKRTRAILPVHLYGQMCDMKEIHRIARKYSLVIIEDAAHCIEGERDGIKVGELGDAACFSFYATKNITSGEGGAVATNNVQKADLLMMLRLHGIDRSAIDRYSKKYQHWDMSLLGWKYNMDNIHASLLINQIDRIPHLWERRNKIWKIYEDALSTIKGIRILKTIPKARHARHLFTVIVEPEKRDAVLWAIQENNIGVAVNYRAIHLLKYYRDHYGFKPGDFPIAERIGAGTISLPLYPGLKDEEIYYVIETIKTIMAGMNE